MPAEDRRPVTVDVHTADLPANPQRDSVIPVQRWIEAPDSVKALGAEFGATFVVYIRRIGRYLLWRAGPPRGGDAAYLAIAADDLGAQFTFRLLPSGDGEGTGPDGRVHHRFRTWKEALRDA